MSLKITTLIENMPDDAGKLAYEHGFSVFLEIDGKRILFDTGQSGAFVENAEMLGINLSEVDAVVLSHGHYDHSGGVPVLLPLLKENTPVYVGKEFFLPKYKALEDGTWKYNGNPFAPELLTEKVQLHFVEENVTRLYENVFLFKNFARRTSYEEINPKFYIKTEAGYEPDLFVDEIALGIVTQAGLVLVAGCSHVGIVNMLEHVKEHLGLPVVAVLGGTHLVEAGSERLLKTVEALKTHGVRTVAVSHCTGEEGMKLLEKEFAQGFVRNNTGYNMEISLVKKAIITDLDRTLLRTDKTISEYSLEVLKKCHERGILIMAATARPERAILEYHNQVRFDAMVVTNGARVCVAGQELGGYPMDKESVKVILERLCNIPDVIISLECGSEVYSNIEIPEWEAIVFRDFPNLPTKGTIYKILASRQGENISPLVETMLTEDTSCNLAGHELVQVINKKATKWNGIQMMLEATGVLPENAVYFGDDNDDIEPLRQCGIGVAVANAIDEAKEAADVVVENNNEDGVAKWIERSVLA